MIYANVMKSALTGLTRTAKVKGYKAKEAFRVGKGKAKYAASKVPGNIASKFPKTAATAGKYKTDTGDAFKTFGKTKSGIKMKMAKSKANKYLNNNLGTIATAGGIGYLGGLAVPKKEKKSA